MSDMTPQEIRSLAINAAVLLTPSLGAPMYFQGGDLRQPWSADDVAELNLRTDAFNAAIMDRTFRIAARFEQWVESGDVDDRVPDGWADE